MLTTISSPHTFDYHFHPPPIVHRQVPLKLSYGGELRRVRLNSHYGIIAFDVLVATAKSSFPSLADNKLHFTWMDDGTD